MIDVLAESCLTCIITIYKCEFFEGSKLSQYDSINIISCIVAGDAIFLGSILRKDI